MEQEYKYMVCTRCFTFNHAPYIMDAMNGFTMQETTFPVVTCIVDDASTDGEQDVIRQYLADHFQEPYCTEETEYAHVIRTRHNTNPNCEFVVFLLKYNHYSIKKTKIPYLSEWLDNAKYHAFCEGDDYWIHSGKLQMQVNFMEEHESVGLCYTDSTIYVQKTGVFKERRDERTYKKPSDLFIHNPIYTQTTLFRVSLFRKYEEDVQPNTQHWKIGDLPIWIWFSLKSKVTYLDEVTSVYRLLENSASHNVRLEPRRDFIISVYNVAIFYINHYFNEDVQLRKEVENRKNRRLANLYAKHQEYGHSFQIYMTVNPKMIKDWVNIFLIKYLPVLYRLLH